MNEAVPSSLKYGSIDGALLEGGTTKQQAGPVESFSERRSQLLQMAQKAGAALLFLVLVGTVAMKSTISSSPSSGSTGFMAAARSQGNGASGVSATITYMSLCDEEQETLFGDFMASYSKTYVVDSTEYVTRLSNFKTTLQVIDDRNAAEAAALGDGVHGVTKFADLTQAEYEETYLMSFYEEDEYAGTDADRRRLQRREETRAEQVSLLAAFTKKRQQRQQGAKRGLQETTEVSASASIVDWSTSITSAVNDQGTGCRAASWAFTAAQQIESDAVRKGYLTLADTLSVQQLLDCNTNSDGCTSGSLESAYDYSSKPGALHTAAQYPYVYSSGECADSGSDYSATLGSYATVTKYHNEETGYSTTQVESNMLAHLVATGTLSACMDASTWNTYVSGSLASCVGTTINQCTQVVGVYYDPIADVGYYKVRNSWGTDWGEDGYIRLAHGVNACQLVYNPGYTDPAASLGRRT